MQHSFKLKFASGLPGPAGGAGLSSEQVDDRVATLLQAGDNVTLTYNDVANTLTIAATGGGGGLTTEQVDDRVAALLQAGTNVTLTYDDAANTLTIAAPGVAGLTAEEVDDRVAALLTAGSNITLTYNDVANTLTIAANSGLTQEQVDDRVATLLTAGTNVSLSYNDAAGTLTIAAAGGGGTISGDADSITSAVALEAATGIDAGLDFLRVKGYAAEGDCEEFIVERVAGGTDITDYEGKLAWTDADGVKWRRAECARVHMAQMGIPPADGTTPSTPYFDAFKAWAIALYGWNGQFPILDLQNLGRSGWFRVDTPWIGKGGRFQIEGGGSGQHGGQKSSVIVSAGVTWLILDADRTLEGVDEGVGLGTNGGADGTIVRGVLQYRDTNNTEAEGGFGILSRVRCFIEHCQFVQNGNAGVLIWGDNTSGSNANNWIVRDCVFEYNRVSGLWVLGIDANAGMGENLSLSGNGRWGIREDSFLGNNYYTLHFENNGTGAGGSGVYPTYATLCWYANNVYQCIYGQETNASTTTPGTNNAVWEYLFNDPTNATFGGGAPTWVSGMTWYSGGSFLVSNFNARNLFSGVYIEGGEINCQIMSPRSIVQDGGCKDLGGITKNSPGIYEEDGYRFGAPYRTISWETSATSGNELYTQYGGRLFDTPNILSWERKGAPGVSPTSSWMLGSSDDDAYFLKTDGGQGNSLDFIAPGSTMDSDHEATSGNFYSSIATDGFLRFGPAGFTRAINVVQFDPSTRTLASNYNNTGIGNLYFKRLQTIGKAIGWAPVRGASNALKARSELFGYIQHRVHRHIDPGTVNAGAVSSWYTIDVPGVTASTFITDSAIEGSSSGNGLMLQAECITDQVRFRFVNPTGGSNETPGTLLVKFNLKFDERLGVGGANQIRWAGRTWTSYAYDPGSFFLIPGEHAIVNNAGHIYFVDPGAGTGKWVFSVWPISGVSSGSRTVSIDYVSSGTMWKASVKDVPNSSAGAGTTLGSASGATSGTLSFGYTHPGSGTVYLILESVDGAGNCSFTNLSIT